MTYKQVSTKPRSIPVNLEAEESLLGAMLLSKDAIADAIEVCKSSDFYKHSHQYIFDALRSIYIKGDPADTTTVADELKRKDMLEEVGGVPQLMKLQANTPAISNAFSYAEIVAEHSLLRRLIRAASDIAERAYELPDDVVEVIDWAETKIFQLRDSKHGDSVLTTIDEAIKQVLDRLDEIKENPGKLSGIPTGFTDLDKILNGFQSSDLIILGARPGMGKTSFALEVGANVAVKQRVPVLMFSLEMKPLDLTQRLISSESLLDSSLFRTGQLNSDDERLSNAVSQLSGTPFIIANSPNFSLADIRAQARRVKARSGLGLIIVDYLQLMSGRRGAESRRLEVTEISRGLKILAMELDVPILALSQLSRSLESRPDKRPMPSDLSESGSLESDADVVLFIYRDEVYNAQSPDRGTAELIVSKHRSGSQGVAKLAFLERFTKFANMARQIEPQD